MSENTKLWDILGRTDPTHTKAFTRGGGFKGTAIKPIWSFKRMTEEFGPCGKGWGVGEPVFQVVPGDNREVLVYCTASIWWKDPEQDQLGSNPRVYGVGGDKVVSYVKANAQYNRPERWESDDEAFKKAFTDAVTNALKLIGVGADVHMGMFDDSKYVNTMREEFSEPAPVKRDKDAIREDGTKSSAALKRDGAWQKLMFRLSREFGDCKDLRQFEMIKDDWRLEAKREGFNAAYLSALKNEFDTFEEGLKKLLADELDDTFPGDLPPKGNAYADNYRAG